VHKVVVLGVATISFMVWVLVRYGSVSAARQHFAGQSLAVTASELTVEGAAGEQAVAEFELQNVSSVPVTIHGAETQCRCVALEKFPITIKPGFSRRLPIGVRVNDHEDRDSLNESVKLFTSPSGSPIVLRVIVQVAKRSLKHEPLMPEPDELFSNAGN
jgi:hypothetical protein